MAQHLHQESVKLLAIDVGNTSTAVGVWRDGRVGNVKHIDGAFAEVKTVLDVMLAGKKYDAAAYASVVPGKDAKFRRYFKAAGVDFIRIGWRDFPLKLDYPAPETIGADRLADAAGAVERYGAPVLVMDFGTALTAAVVTGDGVWRGGVIAPGFPLMRDYLFERTAKLPRMKIGSGRAPAIGRSTEEAMRFGAIVGYRGMVREIAAQLKENFKEDFRLVATGGFAKWALRDSRMDFTVDPDLTLYGIGLIAAKTKRRNV
jgi:type III pantothenate kinase